MTTLTIRLEDEKSEQAIKAVLNALGIEYDEVGEKRAFSEQVIAGVNKAKEDVKSGRVKPYEGLGAIIRP